MQFLSDHSVAGNGFRLEWRVDGCGGILKKATGDLTSPNYPNVYPVNVVCEWRIETALGTSIQLVIHEFDLEGARDCKYDFLHIYGGPDDTAPLLTSLCQQRSQNATTHALGNHMFIRFKSDGSIRGKGFSATYNTVQSGK